MPRHVQNDQRELFAQNPLVPEGFVYADDILSGREESELVKALEILAFAPFDFHGFLGKRRIVSFGWRYDYSGRALRQSSPMPDFLLPLRAAASRFAKVPPDSFQQALVTEYAPGAGIGWQGQADVRGCRGVFASGGLHLAIPQKETRRRLGEDFSRSQAQVGLSVARCGQAGMGA
jgi:alkylated DNA repair dioxygenase AlkB